jgi:hypothetical protein
VTTTLPPSAVPSAASLLVDELLPSFDVRIAEHRIVDADPATTWDALVHLDLMQVHTPLLDAAFWVRGLPARLHRTSAAAPPAIVLGELGTAMPGWLRLGEDPGHELAIGAVGRFWTPTIEWRDVGTPEAFGAFDEPGWGKIGVSFSVLPYGAHRTLLTYECRTATTDERSGTAFARYWKLVRPFVGHIMRATLRTVARRAERRSPYPSEGATR